MDHNFIESQIDSNKCAKCKYTHQDHTDRATCEACGNTGTVTEWAGMLLCMDCLEKEKVIFKQHQSPENQDARAREHNEQNNKHSQFVQNAKKVDNQITIRTDLFNAETVATMKVFEQIDADETIQNKLFAKAEFLKDRVMHFQEVVFQARQVLEAGNSGLRSAQEKFNQISNFLRKEEREKLKISDLNYKPEPPKKVKSSKTPPKKKHTIHEVREICAKHGIADAVGIVQMMVTSRNIHPEDAAIAYKKQMGL